MPIQVVDLLGVVVISAWPRSGYSISIGFALLIGLGLHAGGQVKSALLIGITLSITSLGIVAPVLHDAGQVCRSFGQLVIAGASIARPWSSSTIRSQIHRPW